MAAPQPLPEGEKLHGTLPPGLGEWLFKDKDQVLGPVAPELLVNKLYDGEVAADTPVAREIGQWRPLREVWFLGAHVPRAQQRTAYLRARTERAEAAARQARTRVMLGAMGFAVVFLASLGLVSWLMRERPWADKTDWFARRPAFAALPDRTPPPRLAVATPPPKAADAPAEDKKPDDKKAEEERKAAEEMAAAEEKKAGDDDKKGKKGKKGKDGKEDPKKVAAADPKGGKKEAPKEELKKEAPVVPAVAQELSNEQIMSTFKASAGGYTGCIREEAARNPDMPGTITVEFIIRNDGSTADFKVQEREIRTGPLAACLSGKIGALRFPKFTGERKQFIFPFKITRRK
jgi:hypothetical protein